LPWEQEITGSNPVIQTRLAMSRVGDPVLQLSGVSKQLHHNTF
jgi:hypothetical protein